MSEDRSKAASKAGLWYTLGNILLKGCVFFTLPIFTRILSTKDFGIYNSYIAYENLIQAFLGLGLYGTLKNAKIDFKYRFNEYVSSIFFMSILFFLAVLCGANMFYPLYANVIGFSRLTTNCLLFQSFGGYFIHFYGTKLNAEFKYKPYLAISVINTLGSIILSILLIIFVFPNERYLGRVFGSAFPPIVIVLLIGFIVIIKGKKLYDKELWRYALLIGIPLVPHVISQSILSQFDRIMINNMIGSSEAGIYSSIYTICTIMYVICLSIDNAWTPWLFFEINDNNKGYVYTASKKYVELFAILCAGFICVMPEISKVFLTGEYWEGMQLLVPLTAANYCIFLYLMPVSIEYFNKKTAFISLGTFFAAVLNIILNYISLTFLGYGSAAYTTWFSYFALFIFHYCISRKYNISEIIDIKHVFVVTSLFFIFAIVVISTAHSAGLNMIIRVSGLILILSYAIKNKNYLLGVVRRIKE